MPKTNSKRSRALEQLQIAQDALAKALTLLGGRPKSRSSAKLPQDHDRTSREYIVSCINRLNTTQFLLTSKIPSEPNSQKFKSKMNQLMDAFPELRNAKRRSDLRDDFEREYDAERRPQC